MQGSGRYKLHDSLVKQLKLFHPASKVEWGCTECSLIGKGHAPLRSVKDHFAKLHPTRQSTVRVPAKTALTTTATTTRYAATTTMTTGTTATAGPNRRPLFSQQRSDFSTAPGSLSLQRPRPVQKTLSNTAATTTTVNTKFAGTASSSHGGTSRTRAS